MYACLLRNFLQILLNPLALSFVPFPSFFCLVSYKRLLLILFVRCSLQFCSPFYRCYHNYRNIIPFRILLVLLPPYSLRNDLLELPKNVRAHQVPVNFSRFTIHNKLKFVHAEWMRREKKRNTTQNTHIHLESMHKWMRLLKFSATFPLSLTSFFLEPEL